MKTIIKRLKEILALSIQNGDTLPSITFSLDDLTKIINELEAEKPVKIKCLECGTVMEAFVPVGKKPLEVQPLRPYPTCDCQKPSELTEETIIAAYKEIKSESDDDLQLQPIKTQHIPAETFDVEAARKIFTDRAYDIQGVVRSLGIEACDEIDRMAKENAELKQQIIDLNRIFTGD